MSVIQVPVTPLLMFYAEWRDLSLSVVMAYPFSRATPVLDSVFTVLLGFGVVASTVFIDCFGILSGQADSSVSASGGYTVLAGIFGSN